MLEITQGLQKPGFSHFCYKWYNAYLQFLYTAPIRCIKQVVYQVDNAEMDSACMHTRILGKSRAFAWKCERKGRTK